LFRSLTESREILPQEALALAGAIHAGLRKPPGHNNGAAYAEYARTMALLKHTLPDLHDYVISHWRLSASRVNRV
jgi:hypothetical protein